MQNRAVRQESRTVQRHLSNGSVENEHIEAQTQPQNNNDDILSLDLLTPLTASPAGAGAVGVGAAARKNFPNSNKSQSQTITPTSITESPNGPVKREDDNASDDTKPSSASSAPGGGQQSKSFQIGLDMDIDMHQNYAFADIINLHDENGHDGHFDNSMGMMDDDINFDILSELQKMTEQQHITAAPTTSTTTVIATATATATATNEAGIQTEVKPLSNSESTDALPSTIRPLDIKMKADTSVQVNNQNVTTSTTSAAATKNTKTVSTATPPPASASASASASPSDREPPKNTSPAAVKNINNGKPKTVRKPSPNASHPTLSLTPQPNELQTQARTAPSSKISSSVPAKDAAKPITKCNNCGTTKTPLWRKGPNGNTLCNACGLFLKLHGTMRPLSLKTDVIKKRNSKRQSVSAQSEGYKNINSSNSQNNTPVNVTPFPSSIPNMTGAGFNNMMNVSMMGMNMNMTNMNSMNMAGNSNMNLNLLGMNMGEQLAFYPQSVPAQHNNINSINPSTYTNSPQQPFVLKSHNSSSSLASMSGSMSLSRSKNVPILPKPAARDSTSPGTPNSASGSTSFTTMTSNNAGFTVGSASSQPQDIPHFKRRKSKLNLATSLQSSQPSSPMTYSPSSSSTQAYSPLANMTPYSPAQAGIINSPANSSLFARPGSQSRHNSTSSHSASSYNLYQDLHTKRGLSYTQMSYSNSQNGINGAPSTINPTQNGGLFKTSYSGANTKKPANFSNLSAGMNAIRSSSNSGNNNNNTTVNSSTPSANISGRSSLSKCVASGTDTQQLNSGDAAEKNGGAEVMQDLDWLKFDI